MATSGRDRLQVSALKVTEGFVSGGTESFYGRCSAIG